MIDPMRDFDRRVARAALARKAVTRAQLAECLSNQARRTPRPKLIDVMLERGVLPPTVYRRLADYYIQHYPVSPAPYENRNLVEVATSVREPPAVESEDVSRPKRWRPGEPAEHARTDGGTVRDNMADEPLRYAPIYIGKSWPSTLSILPRTCWRLLVNPAKLYSEIRGDRTIVRPDNAQLWRLLLLSVAPVAVGMLIMVAPAIVTRGRFAQSFPWELALPALAIPLGIGGQLIHGAFYYLAWFIALRKSGNRTYRNAILVWTMAGLPWIYVGVLLVSIWTVLLHLLVSGGSIYLYMELIETVWYAMLIAQVVFTALALRAMYAGARVLGEGSRLRAAFAVSLYPGIWIVLGIADMVYSIYVYKIRAAV